MLYLCVVILIEYRKDKQITTKLKIKMTLLELYQQVKKQNRPVAPATAFVREVAAVTKKSELAVRRWIAGETEPDALTQEVLAKHFGTTPESLFPAREPAGRRLTD